MREYTAKEMKELRANPYTFKVTKKKLYFTAEFKEAFWNGYQAGIAPKKLLEDLGYDTKMFGQKQIDSLVQRIKKQAEKANGFTEGENRTKRTGVQQEIQEVSQESVERIWNEVKYLRQEVEFLKKIARQDNAGKKKRT